MQCVGHRRGLIATLTSKATDSVPRNEIQFGRMAKNGAILTATYCKAKSRRTTVYTIIVTEMGRRLLTRLARELAERGLLREGWRRPIGREP